MKTHTVITVPWHADGQTKCLSAYDTTKAVVAVEERGSRTYQGNTAHTLWAAKLFPTPVCPPKQCDLF